MFDPAVQEMLIYVGSAILTGSAIVAFVATARFQFSRSSPSSRSPRRDAPPDKLPTLDF